MRPVASDPKLGDEVHVWRISLSPPQDRINLFFESLSPEEKQRSTRFHLDRDRRRFTVARGSLRSILSEYLNKSPAELQFASGPYGKPFIVHTSSIHEIQFNLSHCEDLVLIAVTDRRLVGIDVERVQKLRNLHLMLDRFFTGQEREFVDSAPRGQKFAAFLTLWSRREACAKALGLGLAAALSALDVPVYPQGSNILLGHLGDGITDRGESKKQWFVRDLALGPYHVGAVSVEGKKCSLVCRNSNNYRFL